MPRVNLIGRCFGRLAVTHATDRDANGNQFWFCHCVCGGFATVRGDNLRNGNTSSCGCINRENNLRRTANKKPKPPPKPRPPKLPPAAAVWRNMMARCYNPAHPFYKDYGGRGIIVCDRWHMFPNFYTDMGDPPPGLSIDRYPNNDGNYEPGNVRWATHSEQMRNRRRWKWGPNDKRRRKQPPSIWFNQFDKV